MSASTLCLDSVVCVDEMGGSWREKFGNDEIYLGAIGIDSSGGAIKVPFFEVYANFDDGDIKRFNPPRALATLASDGVCRAILVLAERQHGGMSQALDSAYSEAVSKLAAAKADGAGGDVAAAIAMEVGKWLGKSLLEESKDKVFPIQEVALQETPGVAEFTGHDGKYTVNFHWEAA